MNTTYTTDQAISILAAEGFAQADINIAINSLSECGFEVQIQDDEDQMLTSDELSVLRSQLTTWTAEAE